jgi:acetylornithine deacetylase
MDSLDLVATARKLIDIDSTTGREARVASVIAEQLRALGYRVTLQPVAGDRVNVIASIDDPVVVFSTHFDCVPEFFPSRVDNGRL